jgi:hypothetical protein
MRALVTAVPIHRREVAVAAGSQFFMIEQNDSHRLRD